MAADVATASPSAATFSFYRWLDHAVGLEASVAASGSFSEATTVAEYAVEVVTSDRRGAGTDARVYLEVEGTKGVLGERILKDAEDNFERGR